MTFTIKSGDSGNVAKVDGDSRLFTRSVSQGPLEEEASARGNAAYWYSTWATGGTDKDSLSIRNTDEKHLHITRLFLGATGACIWKLFQVTSGTTAGTAVVIENSDLGSAVANSHVSFGNNEVTGTLAGPTLHTYLSAAGAMISIFLEGSLILRNTDEIVIQASASTTVHISVIGFWDAE